MQENDVIDICRQLISVPSITGHEDQVARKLTEICQHLDFDQVQIDALGNVVAVVDHGPGPKILFDAHLDTVDPGETEKWQFDPYQGLIYDGKLFGRGAADMKGALASMVYALGTLAKDDSWKGQLFLSGTVCEEPAEGVALKHVLKDVNPEIVIIGEATDLRLNFAQRGRLELSLKAGGKPAHSANPAHGENAVYKMAELIRILRTMPAPSHPVLGDGVLEVTDIISDPFPGLSVIPASCTVTIDRRLLPGETPKSVFEQIQSYLRSAKAADGWSVSVNRTEIVSYTGRKLQSDKFAPGWILDDDELVQRVCRQLKASGLKFDTGFYGFCTNGSASAELGIPTLGYGPGKEEQAHTIDEYVLVQQLVDAARGYQTIAKALGDGR